MNDDTAQPAPDSAETETKPEVTGHQETAMPETTVSHLAKPHHGSKFNRLKQAYLSKKKLSIPLTILFLLGILLAIPPSRYLLAGTVLKTSYQVAVFDEVTKQPVSNVTIGIDGRTAVTDNNGLATIKTRVGNKQLSASKKYYKDFSRSVLVPIKRPTGALPIFITATGRQVPIVVTNKITGKPIENASVKAADTEAKTDKDGKVIVVLPADKTELEATLSAAGHNDAKVMVKVIESQSKDNEFTLTPAGKIYFLSKQSGKIDVVKTNLDGTERKTILAGTGNEDEGSTVLLASRDWKYLALHAKREGKYAKLYLIETASDKLTTMDEGEATFNISGWSDNYFVYKVERANAKAADGKAQALKSFNADSKQIKVLTEAQAEGTNTKYYTSFDYVFLLDNKVVYISQVRPESYSSTSPENPTLQTEVNSIKTDGSGKKTLKSWPAGEWTSYYSSKNWNGNYVSGYVSGLKEVYFTANVKSANEFYELNKEEFKQLDKESSEARQDYLTYLESPSKSSVFWYEERDGKNNLFIGNSEAQQPKEVAVLSEYVTYGWYTDGYLLISKKGSELYILPAAEKVSEAQILKISDYHKPSYNYYGYGGGYGGL